MKVLSLFSGGGLGDYGLTLAGMEIVGQVEIDDYCQKILSLRWPDVPKWRDVREVKGSEVIERCGQPDIISGGFPCQDISTAGKGAGITGARSGLWKEMFRIIREVRPRYVLVENVTALLGRGLGVVLGDLAEIGYDCEWDCIPASALGAPHQRDRVWIVAHATSQRTLRRPGEIQQADGRQGKSLLRKSIGSSEIQGSNTGLLRSTECQEQTTGIEQLGKNLANTGCQYESRNTKGMETKKAKRPTCIISSKPSRERHGRHWFVEPNVGRVAHGITKRVDRLKLLGNGQVVQVVEWIGKHIIKFDEGTK